MSSSPEALMVRAVDAPRTPLRARVIAPRVARWSLAALLLAGGAVLAQTSTYPGIGRPATDKEVAAWDIDVRPDFKGLPKGSGSVAQGMDIWEAKCASCHGVFGESNEIFSPLVGGTTAEDIQTGRVARLLDAAYPGRTTLMKVPTVSTLWDYINRAMPWNAPKTLSANEVYAVTAYLLNMGGVVADNFTMSDANIAQVQARMPNRKGMSIDHGLWPGKGMGNGGQADVKAVACMKDCTGSTELRSFLPDFARNAHGNLAEQNRVVGAQLGADTTRPAGSAPTSPAGRAPEAPAAAAPKAPAPVSPAAPAAPAGKGQGAPTALLQQHNCLACHGMDKKLVGPGLAEVARKYAARADRVSYLSDKIQTGGAGVWGAIPMPAQTLSADEAKRIAQWLADGAKK